MNTLVVRARRGFTLVELLVVITIVGMMMAMLFPAISVIKDRANNIRYQNNLSQLAKAAAVHETQKRRYPGYVEYNPVAAGNNMMSAYGWPVVMLPYVGRGDLWGHWRAGNRTEVPIDQYRCPGDTSAETLSISYVANCGYQDNRTSAVASTARPPDWPANGVFHSLYDPAFISGATNNCYLQVRMTTGDVKDGLQQTLMFSENIQAGLWCAPLSGATSEVQLIAETTLGFIWRNDVNPTISNANAGYRINSNRDFMLSATGLVSTSYTYARPSSNHPGGVNAVFCDGHLKFLSESIDYVVYQLLMTPDGRNARTPRNATPNLNAAFYSWLLTEADY